MSGLVLLAAIAGTMFFPVPTMFLVRIAGVRRALPSLLVSSLMVSAVIGATLLLFVVPIAAILSLFL